MLAGAGPLGSILCLNLIDAKNPYEAGEKSRNKKPRFIDIEALDTDEEGELDEEEEYADLNDTFIETANVEHARNHVRFDRELEIEDDKNAEDIARQLTERYKTRPPSRFIGDRNEIPQRLLVPSVQDPGLWRIRVKVPRHIHLLFCIDWYLAWT